MAIIVRVLTPWCCKTCGHDDQEGPETTSRHGMEKKNVGNKGLLVHLEPESASRVNSFLQV